MAGAARTSHPRRAGDQRPRLAGETCGALIYSQAKRGHMGRSAMDIPSPAVSFVGRHNSGKTTFIERLIRELAGRGLDVGTVKHHGHGDFEIDVPGKDSWRHRAAGASETVISAPGKIAKVKTIDGEAEGADVVRGMPNHDIVLVEGYRKCGFPSIEVMRAGNAADEQAAEDFARRVGDAGQPAASPEKLPTDATVGVVTDIPRAAEAARILGIPVFGFDDVEAVADFLQASYTRPRLTVAVQAGGQSTRMGRDKATVPFLGQPLVARLVERMAPVADEVIVTTNDPDGLSFLEDLFPTLGIRLVPDALDAPGAVPGIYTALQAANHDQVAIVACDMVCASPRLAEAELLELCRTGADAVVPKNRNGFEPFHAVYRKSTCLPVALDMAERGVPRAKELFARVKTCEFTMRQVRAAEPAGWCFANANTPEELRLLERMVESNEIA